MVPIEQNGTGSPDTITEIFDEEGRRIWLRDARGFITFSTYDSPTGSLIQTIQDVDGTKVELPSGWSTPTSGGLNLVTDYTVDALGRTTQVLGPPHEVDGQTVRTASWTVYRDRDDEVLNGQGYVLAVGPNAAATLVNPVSISRMSADGRVQDSITAVRGCAALQSCDGLVSEVGLVESPGRLSAGDCFPQHSWVRWSQTLLDDHGLTIASRVYHRIPAEGAGLAGTNYDETRYGYDQMARQNRVVDPTGTIDRTVFDVRGLTVSTWTGTDDRRATDSDPTGDNAASNNMVQLTANEYDGGTDGGDGNLTQQTLYVDAVTTRVTTFTYDFRSRQIAIDGEEDFYQEQVYDNLNQVIRVDQRDGHSGGNLVARRATNFDDRGRIYQTRVDAVDPATGAVGNSLISNTWFDAAGNVLCSLSAGSQAFTKMTYDGVGRTIASYIGYNPDDEITPDSVEDDLIFEQTEVQYDAASNVLMTTSRQRWDNATGTRPLQGPAGDQPRSRDSYMAMWYDGVGRGVASANYGTNGEVGPPERPDGPPESSDDVLVSLTAYNARGEAFETTDPAGRVARSYSDDAGRTVRTIQNYVAVPEPACFCPGAEQNVVTEMRYQFGQFTALVAKNSTTGDQVTRYEYGVTRSTSDLASNRLLRAEVYAEAIDSTDRVTYAYNRRGQITRMTDRNGSVHEYEYDGLGRLVGDSVTTLAEGV
ncbi:MAG: RHS repeat protein, partial [Bacteroidales bacterium]|nr:RHS repeat protein [Bacteroidales bacterium]